MKTAVAKIHLSLNVSDVEESKRWYEVFFGVAAHKVRPGYANFDLDSPPLKLALEERRAVPVELESISPRKALKLTIEQRAAGTGGNLNHLGMLVSSTEEVLATKDRLERSGLITFSEENVTCCYARQDKIWVRDPDGNAWEVYVLLDDMLSEAEVHACTVADNDGSSAECCK